MRRFIADNNNSGQADDLEHSSGPEPQVIRAALDAIVLQSLRPVCMGLSVLYLIFAVSHRVFLPSGVAALMSMVAAASAALLLALYFVLRRYSISSHLAHPIGAA